MMTTKRSSLIVAALLLFIGAAWQSTHARPADKRSGALKRTPLVNYRHLVARRTPSLQLESSVNAWIVGRQMAFIDVKNYGNVLKIIDEYPTGHGDPYKLYTAPDAWVNVLAQATASDRSAFVENMKHIDAIDRFYITLGEGKGRLEDDQVRDWYRNRTVAIEDTSIKIDVMLTSGSLEQSVDSVTIDPTEKDTEAKVKDNYEVLFVNRLLYGHPSYYQTFDKYSSPTEKRQIEAGLYMFWCRRTVGDDQFVEGPPREIEIKHDTTIVVEIPFEYRKRPPAHLMKEGDPSPAGRDIKKE